MEPKLSTFGIWELVIILLIVVVIFGAAKLPQLGSALGKSIRNFRKSFKDEPGEIQGEARRIEEGAAAGELPAAGSSASEKSARERMKEPADHE